MAFKMKKSVDVEKRVVTFSAVQPAEGDAPEKVLFAETFELSKVSDDIGLRLALHGASQKIGDSYAGAGGDDVADPLAFTREAIAATIKQLVDGDWKVGATGGPRVSDLATAIAAISGQPVEAVSEMLEAARDEERKALRKDPVVASKLAEIALQKAQERARKLAEAAGKAEGGALAALLGAKA